MAIRPPEAETIESTRLKIIDFDYYFYAASLFPNGFPPTIVNVLGFNP
jgi:hypothetical protein